MQKIQKIIDKIPIDALNNTGEICINAIHNEFSFINGSIVMPKLPVSEISVTGSTSIIKDIAVFIPEYLHGHTVSEKRIPPSNQHMLHFTKVITGSLFSFLHIFKIDLKFGGDPSTIIEKGTVDFYPSFKTDRLYYKSLLIPMKGFDGKFTPLRLITSNSVDFDQTLFTSALFEDVDKSGITMKIWEKLPENICNISPKLYPFVLYDYFTACLSVLQPTQKNLQTAAALYEPLFLYIYDCFEDINTIAKPEEIIKVHSSRLEFNEDKLQLNQTFIDELKEYFAQYRLEQDDEMALKHWRRFVWDVKE